MIDDYLKISNQIQKSIQPVLRQLEIINKSNKNIFEQHEITLQQVMEDGY